MAMIKPAWNKPVCALLTLPLALAGCGARLAGEGGPPSGLQAEKVNYGAEVTIGRCVMVPEGEFFDVAGIGAALLGSAITKGVNRVGKVLNNSAQRDERTATAMRNMEVTAAAFGPCVQIARAWHYLDSKSEGALKEPAWAATSFLSGGRHTTLWRNGLWLASAPDFFFEGRFRPSQDGTYLTIEPVYARLDDPIARRMLRPGGERHVTIKFAFPAANEALNADTAPGTTLVIGELRPGQEHRYGTGERMQMVLEPPSQTVAGAVPPPAPTGNTAQPGPTGITGSTAGTTPGSGFGERPAGFGGNAPPDLPTTTSDNGTQAGQRTDGPSENATIIRSPLESDWFSISLPPGRQKIKVVGEVVEVQDKSEFLAFLAELFTENQTAIDTQLQAVLVPPKREAAREAARTARQTAEGDWERAFTAAHAALDACRKGGGDVVALAVTARDAMRTLNNASRTTGKPEPFPQDMVERINLGGRDADISNACRSALGRIRPNA